MLKNYFLLKELAEYLDFVIRDHSIREVYSQEKNKFIICLGNDENTDLKFIEFSCDRSFPYLILKNKFSKAKKNSVSLFGEINNSRIKSISLYNDDRIIEFKLSNSFSLFFLFFTGKLNFFVCKNNIIINAFKNRNLFAEKTLTDLLKTKDRQPDVMRKIETIKDFFKSKYLRVGNLFFEELLHNLNLRQDDLLDNSNKEIIEKEFERYFKFLSTPEYLLYNKSSDIEISLFKLNHLSGYNVRKFSNVNELIGEYIKNYFKETKKKTIKELRLNEFRKKILGVEKKISGLIKQVEESKKSEWYYIYGEQILANIHKLKKGDKKLLIKDDKTGETISIKLNETITPSDNAQKYFKKYKRQKDSVNVLKEKINTFKKKKSDIEKEMKKLTEVQDYKVLSKMEKHQRIKEKVDKETSMFRKFSLDENYEVWVGKNSKSNDLLTTKYSSPNDFWFHVRGASGSHTVLKISNKKVVVDKKTIQTTASIAAYYSKARNASNVPVAYCERKYVKKKKGFKQGSVVMSREKVVFVKPGLPDSTN